LLVSGATMDDAGVYKLNEEQAIVQTVDFFTPMVDDPFTFGQITACNSLSDVYAMGGKPLTAMNIIAFPVHCMDLQYLRDIMAGGAEKLIEAETLLVGGHTIEDDVPKYGLSVTGLVHPKKIWTNVGARSGDILVLTKPIGTGIISTAIKGGIASKEEEKLATELMIQLNKYACEALRGIDVHGCTDITGFGLLGHTYEMAHGSACGFQLDMRALPILPGVRAHADIGVVPAGARRNQDYLQDHIVYSQDISDVDKDILTDPQTSGGLLVAIQEKDVDRYLKALEQREVKGYVVGQVIPQHCGKVFVKGGK
jgi:selenide,water dikinase